jgi:hypothetical protein
MRCIYMRRVPGAAIDAFFAAEGRASPDPALTNDPAFIFPVTHIE